MVMAEGNLVDNHSLRASRVRVSMLLGSVGLGFLLAAVVLCSPPRPTELNERDNELFKTALASQQADLARHRAHANKVKSTAKKLSASHSNKRAVLSDAKLFKDAVEEQHEELAKQRVAEAKARTMERGGSAPSSLTTRDVSDATLLKDAIKSQHAENKKVSLRYASSRSPLPTGSLWGSLLAACECQKEDQGRGKSPQPEAAGRGAAQGGGGKGKEEGEEFRREASPGMQHRVTHALC